ncbi:MAG: hypothetical protein COV66_04695 [Nitrospinae bacterium CG11_big_fil_rev_8_21_14_0_20_45_15]|nr:MAG: hypothetical protein COV66_04695 [Nitrospinae bacterium CG11_big_fil_rev_8_21_14_0_20_45_15]
MALANPGGRRKVEIVQWVEHLQKKGVTPRQMEVIHEALKGLSEKDIAARLSISPTTVNTHLKNIYRKLGVNSRLQLFAKMNDGNHRF